MVQKNKKSPLENSIILRRFSILFFALSFLPFVLVFTFYNQLQNLGLIDNNFVVAFFLMVIGIAIAYWGMRVVLKDLVNVVKVHTQTLGQLLGKERFAEITAGKNEIAILADTFDEVIHQLEENVQRLELAKRTLHSVLRKVGKGLSSNQNIDSFLELIVETVANGLNAKEGVLLLLDEKQEHLTIKVAFGTDEEGVAHRFSVKDGNFRSIIDRKKAGIITHFEAGEIEDRLQEIFFPTPLLCAPLVSHDKVLGMITISGREEGRLRKEEINLLSSIALQTAVAIENSQLNADAEKTYFETISALALAVEAKDQYSRGHLDRVALYAQKISEKMDLSEEQRSILRDSARLHDIGKIGILDEVLRKPGKLSEEEREVMKKHTLIGEGIILPIRSLRNLCDIVRHHHEMLDGSGYPDGLKGEEVTLLTRILTVADIYDALTTDRPYRKALSKAEAFRILTEEFAAKLDQGIVKLLAEVV